MKKEADRTLSFLTSQTVARTLSFLTSQTVCSKTQYEPIVELKKVANVLYKSSDRLHIGWVKNINRRLRSELFLLMSG